MITPETRAYFQALSSGEELEMRTATKLLAVGLCSAAGGIALGTGIATAVEEIDQRYFGESCSMPSHRAIDAVDQAIQADRQLRTPKSGITMPIKNLPTSTYSIVARENKLTIHDATKSLADLEEADDIDEIEKVTADYFENYGIQFGFSQSFRKSFAEDPMFYADPYDREMKPINSVRFAAKSIITTQSVIPQELIDETGVEEIYITDKIPDDENIILGMAYLTEDRIDLALGGISDINKPTVFGHEFGHFVDYRACGLEGMDEDDDYEVAYKADTSGTFDNNDDDDDIDHVEEKADEYGTMLDPHYQIYRSFDSERLLLQRIEDAVPGFVSYQSQVERIRSSRIK